MNTYLITGAILLISLFCIFKKSKNRADVQLLMGLIFFVISVSVTILVNLNRMDKLQTKIVVDEEIPLISMVVKTDTTWIYKDSIVDNASHITKIILHEFKTKPDSLKKAKFEPKLKEYRAYINFDTHDSSLYVSYKDGDKTKIASVSTETILVRSNRNVYQEIDEEYVPDKWTSSLALPTKNSWTELHINAAILDSLISKHKIIETKWKIKK